MLILERLLEFADVDLDYLCIRALDTMQQQFNDLESVFAMHMGCVQLTTDTAVFAVSDLSLVALGDLIDHVSQVRADDTLELCMAAFERRHSLCLDA